VLQWNLQLIRHRLDTYLPATVLYLQEILDRSIGDRERNCLSEWCRSGTTVSVPVAIYQRETVEPSFRQLHRGWATLRA